MLWPRMCDDGHIAMGKPEPIVKGYAAPGYRGRHYDVSVDGQRFLLLKVAATPDGQKPTAPEIHFVLNWFEELKTKMQTK